MGNNSIYFKNKRQQYYEDEMKEDRIDYAYFRPGRGLDFNPTTVDPWVNDVGKWPSDHYALVVTGNFHQT